MVFLHSINFLNPPRTQRQTTAEEERGRSSVGASRKETDFPANQPSKEGLSSAKLFLLPGTSRYFAEDLPGWFRIRTFPQLPATLLKFFPDNLQ
jgi:hypothetical protein